MSSNILIADDDEPTRRALRALLVGREDLRVIAEARTGGEAVSLATAMSPDVVLLDVCMPEMSGPEAAARIAQGCPRARIIALSVHSDRRFVSGMLRAGARGYVVKSQAFEELTLAIDAVCRGESYVCSSLPADCYRAP